MKSEVDLRRALRQYEDERWTLREQYEREMARLNARIRYLRAILARQERQRKQQRHQHLVQHDAPPVE